MILKNFEMKEKNTAVMTVASDPAEFEKAVNEAYLKSRKNIMNTLYQILHIISRVLVKLTENHDKNSGNMSRYQ